MKSIACFCLLTWGSFAQAAPIQHIYPLLALQTASAHPAVAQEALAQQVSVSYGDSITAGWGTTPELGYAGLLAKDAAAILNDHAISGQTACSMAYTQVFHHPAPGLAAGSKYVTMMIGTNDSNLEPEGAYESIFRTCHLAALTWLGVPAGAKATAQSGACVKHGEWMVDPEQPEAELVSTEQGDSMECGIETTGQVIYLWHRIADGDAGSFTYSVDHGVRVTVASSAATAIATTNGGGSGVEAVRIEGVAPGAHILTIENASAGDPNHTVMIYGIGTPPTTEQAQASRIFAAGVPYQLNDASSAKIAQYNTDATNDIAVVAADGIAIHFVDVRHFWLGHATDMMDLLHPNPQGHSEIRDAFEDAISADYK